MTVVIKESAQKKRILHSVSERIQELQIVEDNEKWEMKDDPSIVPS